MNKLTDEQKNVINLMLRSKHDSEGWYKVSDVVWSVISRSIPEDLIEVKNENHAKFIRFTEKGKIVVEYM